MIAYVGRRGMDGSQSAAMKVKCSHRWRAPYAGGAGQGGEKKAALGERAGDPATPPLESGAILEALYQQMSSQPSKASGCHVDWAGLQVRCWLAQDRSRNVRWPM